MPTLNYLHKCLIKWVCKLPAPVKTHIKMPVVYYVSQRFWNGAEQTMINTFYPTRQYFVFMEQVHIMNYYNLLKSICTRAILQYMNIHNIIYIKNIMYKGNGSRKSWYKVKEERMNIFIFLMMRDTKNSISKLIALRTLFI